uniref:Uncharacterized protein n=1 Tax=Tanacetum cinerariifolium TaxID=118510 RepID=A0A699HPE7_TANCI|nr:hypothetical protein [Tanacetum cinerariifolium]
MIRNISYLTDFKEFDRGYVAFEGGAKGFDWSYMADEVPTNMALLAFSDTKVHNSKTCSNTCLKSFEMLKTQYDNLRIEFNKSEFDLAAYKRGLFAPPSIDLSNSGLKKFQHPEFKGYGPKDNGTKTCVEKCRKRTVQKEVRPVWNNVMRTNHQNFSNSRRNFAPTTVLTKSRIIPISTARQSSSRVAAPVSAARRINTAASKPLVNVAKSRSNAFQKSHSLSRRPFYQQAALKDRNLNNNVNVAKANSVNAAKANSVNTAKGNKVTSAIGNQGINDVKSSACWGAPQDALKDQGYFDSGCSMHMTRNISYLTNFKEHDGGFDMKNIVPQKDLTCLLAKATNDESMLSHKRLGKQHKVSFKSKLQNSISQPLFMLHMDLFGPTSNGAMNEFYKEKDIKREYSVARTPQQNRVAKKRNRILIEAARTMLTDSKLPTTFWAEAAVSTACYVQNRVLVVKPYFKTPYKLFKGRSHDLSFMRPFGCHVSILNTIDQLGKFDGKSDEGIFVGYSTTSKAFRVYNIRTRNVEENLHITLLENKPMIAGGGPEWLFNLDAISKSINYALVFAGKNSNDFAGKEASFDEALDSHNKDKHDHSQASESDNHERPNAESSTKAVNTAGPVNTATLTYVDAPLMPDLEDAEIFDDAYDDRDEGAEADYNNIKTVILVSPIPSTKMHKDHPKEHIIGEMEPKKVTQALDDESWVEAMQKELFQFKLLNVWTLVDLPPGKRDIGTKWVYRNKRDQRGIVVRNKARLVAQGHRKEEGIDYDEVFALVARIEAIRLFLAYASFMDFVVYQMNMKSTFLYELLKMRFMLANLQALWIQSSQIECIKWKKLYMVFIKLLEPVKRIFRYLKGQPTLGLWYPKDSPLELIAYSDSDYAGASVDRKSTTGEYIATSNCYGQVLWLQNQLLDYGYNFMQTKIHVDNESAICVVKNLAYHSKTKHINIRHHFIIDSYEKRLIEMVKMHTDYNVADLLTKAFDVTTF